MSADTRGPTTPTAMRLDQQVCFAIGVAHRAVQAVYRPLLDPLGITHPQFLVMLTLWDSSPRSVREIATELHMDVGTLSPLLRRLEAAGFVTRTRSLRDERALDIAVTPAGRKLRLRALRVPEAVNASLGLSQNDFDELYALLERFTVAARTSTGR
ncbi:MarR family winged helix-turn-helix transcriptional regulator [Williamsia sp. CHRR-6]|uniref:MarR family winged helix-turn-helix transcriptional regulator n=1 Tax=Williamsia sp. CHRR-6 TaxID=2835871 RepID=UPI001BDAA3E6|nr:MarR family transcriptional regulator [Williamsia sp. CHRR-6]MBT0567781.1 MarR family transcriptional regulator [Williamsia sp. CHRR-6]